MNCNCRSELEEKLTERFKAAEPTLKHHVAELKGYGFGVVGNKMVITGCMPVEATAERTRKDGTTTVKKVRQTMVFSFCPFCGVAA